MVGKRPSSLALLVVLRWSFEIISVMISAWKQTDKNTNCSHKHFQHSQRHFLLNLYFWQRWSMQVCCPATGWRLVQGVPSLSAKVAAPPRDFDKDEAVDNGWSKCAAGSLVTYAKSCHSKKLLCWVCMFSSCLYILSVPLIKALA